MTPPTPGPWTARENKGDIGWRVLMNPKPVSPSKDFFTCFTRPVCKPFFSLGLMPS